MLKALNLNKTFIKEPVSDTFFNTFRSFFSGGAKPEKIAALIDICFKAGRGEIIAISGDNGAGKTTLLRVLAGTLTPDSGEIIFTGKKAALLGFDSIMNDRLSVYENAITVVGAFGYGLFNKKKAAEALLEEAELGEFRNFPLYKLSAGMKIRIPFLGALNSASDLYLIDEIISVGDRKFREKCFNKIKAIKQEGSSVIFSTHDRNLIRSLADYELCLERGRMRYFRKMGDASNGETLHENLFLNSVKRSERLLEELKQAGYKIRNSIPASKDDLLMVHTANWVNRIESNDLSVQEEKHYALPRSREVIAHSHRLVGATIAASEHALSHGLGVHPLGGAHHAFPDHGAGFCPVNDCAIALKKLLISKKILRPVIVDLDAHQGNGNAFIFDGSQVKTYSIHCAEGYPYDRVRSFMDVDIPAGTGDWEYLQRLSSTLPSFLSLTNPDFCFLLASSDILRDDPVGLLGLTTEGLARRDEFALKELANRGIKTCLAIPGGYGDPEKNAEINFNTIRLAASLYPSFDKLIHI